MSETQRGAVLIAVPLDRPTPIPWTKATITAYYSMMDRISASEIRDESSMDDLKEPPVAPEEVFVHTSEVIEQAEDTHIRKNFRCIIISAFHDSPC